MALSRDPQPIRSREIASDVPHSVGPGDVLAGRYRLEDLLAESGGGRFWRARDTVLERPVAVHVIAADDERAAALLAAARRSAQVLDRRILRVLDAEQDDEICYVVNEWGEGTSLDILVAAVGALDPRRAAWLVGEVADSVAAAHAAGVAHGRLVPENVLVDRHGELRIIGLCVDAAMHGLAGDRAATDVSDLAGLLYCSLTGRWGGASASVVPPAPSHHDRVLRPRRVRAGVPRALDELCDQVLHAAHNSRRAVGVGSARGIADFLAEYVGDPTGMAESLRAVVPPPRALVPVVLPALPDPTVPDGDEPEDDPADLTAVATVPVVAELQADLQAGPAPDPEERPEPEAGSVPGPRPVEQQPTEAGLPIFGEDGDDVSWLRKRSTPPPPPPPFEEPPERPLFASDPTTGEPARRPVQEQGPPARTGFWPWDAGSDSEQAHRLHASHDDLMAGWHAEAAPVDGATPPDDDQVPGRTWLRLAVGILAGLLLLLAVVVAYNLGRGKTPLGNDPEPEADETPSATATTQPAAAPVTRLVATDFDPEATPPDENPEEAPLAVDGDPGTAWRTSGYEQQLGPGGLKSGVGLLVDLGAEREVTGAELSLVGAPTGVALYVVDEAPGSLDGLAPAARGRSEGESLSLDLDTPVTGRFLVVWLTELPSDDGGFRGQVAELVVEAVPQDGQGGQGDVQESEDG